MCSSVLTRSLPLTTIDPYRTLPIDPQRSHTTRRVTSTTPTHCSMVRVCVCARALLCIYGCYACTSLSLLDRSYASGTCRVCLYVCLFFFLLFRSRNFPSFIALRRRRKDDTTMSLCHDSPQDMQLILYFLDVTHPLVGVFITLTFASIVSLYIRVLYRGIYDYDYDTLGL